MLRALSQLQGGDYIATGATLSQEGSAKGIMSLILLSTWLQWVFSFSFFFFLPGTAWLNGTTWPCRWTWH